MTYARVVGRNALRGDYNWPDRDIEACDLEKARWSIAGDLRRMERDQRDELHLAKYAELAGITPAQVGAVLEAFFEGRI